MLAFQRWQAEQVHGDDDLEELTRIRVPMSVGIKLLDAAGAPYDKDLLSRYEQGGDDGRTKLPSIARMEEVADDREDQLPIVPRGRCRMGNAAHSVRVDLGRRIYHANSSNCGNGHPSFPGCWMCDSRSGPRPLIVFRFGCYH